MKKNVLADKNEYLRREFNRLKKLVRRVAQSPYSNFYRKNFETSGFNISDLKEPADWIKVPILERRELEETSPEKRLFVPMRNVWMIRTSSGTTSGKPVILFRSNYRDPKILKQFGVDSFMSLAPYNRSYHLPSAFANTGITAISGDIHDMPRTAKMAADLGVDSILGSPSILLIFNRYLQNAAPALKIRLILIEGEYPTKNQWKDLQILFPEAKIASLYSLAESGSNDSGFPCTETVKHHNRMHLDTKNFFLEIINGEIIMTTLFAGPMPLLRYKTGDAGNFLNEQCACGNSLPLFTVTGRFNGDILRIRGGELRVDEVEKSLEYIFGHKLIAFKLHVFEKQNGNYSLSLEVAVKSGTKTIDATQRRYLGKKIPEKIQFTPNLTLADAIKNGLIGPLGLNMVEKFALEQKQKRIILHEF